MTRTRSILFRTFVLILTLISTRPQLTLAIQSASVAELRPGVVVMRLNRPFSVGKQAARTGIASVDERLSGLGVTRLSPLLAEMPAGKRALRTDALVGIYRVEYGSGISPVQAAARLAADPAVRYAEPLYVHRLLDTPNDEQYENMQQFQQVQAEAAWDVVKGADGDVVIAVVDGGTDWRHPDLEANVWTNTGEIPDNGLDDDDNGFVDDVRGWNFANDTNDPTGLSQHQQSSRHGTHVSGTAAAVTDNGEGVSSLSWNASLMPVNAGSILTDDEIAFGYEGVAYAAANGADVINCSWGRTGGGSRFEQDVIDFAYDNGALVVAAAGNESNNLDETPHFPSSYEKVLSVGASGKTDDGKASFSNYGLSVDVFAPGVQIWSTLPSSAYSPFYSGTSMASPMVSALAALLKTLNPGYSVDELREQVRVTSDAIDAENPAYDGLLGHGRINALRAVTEFSHPSVRFRELDVLDANADGDIGPGETVDLEIEFVNFLADAPALSVMLSTPDPHTMILIGTADLPPLSRGETASVTFRVSPSVQTPIHHRIPFYLDLSGGDYVDRDFFSVVANPSLAADITTGAVTTSITTEGNIGAIGYVGETAGAGFIHDGVNYMFEGGLMIGTGVETVSDCIRSADSIQDQDFRPAVGSELVVVSPGMYADQEGSITLVDSLAAAPIGLTVHQATYADSAPENEDFVIFRYTITNDNSAIVQDLHVGLFFDWDIRTGAIDYADYDSDRKMGFVYEFDTVELVPVRIAATRLLTSGSNVNYRAIDNIDELFGEGFTRAEKWSFLSGGVQRTVLEGRDISQLTAEGPFTLEPGASVEVAFAVIGATSFSEMNASADRAQLFYDSIPTATEPIELPDISAPVLHAAYPNPFSFEMTVSFTLPEPGRTELAVYDMLGRQVGVIVDEILPAGDHEAVWRATGKRQFAPGVYVLRLRVAGTVQSRSIVLSR